jgi:glycerophosphoryl diester phosphodiesterase
MPSLVRSLINRSLLIHFTAINYFVLLLLVLSCESAENFSSMENDYTKIEIQGHRGARGLWPENSLYGFLKAMDLGVDVLEMDVILSADSEVVVSHDPFFSSEICLTPNAEKIENEGDFNLYKLPYKEIAEFDCGSKLHPRFPEQEKRKVAKPLLRDVISKTLEKNPSIKFNIEIKSNKEWLGIYQPESIDHYVDLVVEILDSLPVSQYNLQSFDTAILYSLAERYPNIKLSFLIEDQVLDSNSAKKLGIQLYAVSPDYNLLSEELVKAYQVQGLKVIPWTVNEIVDMRRLAEWGVDGIISDYPDRWMELINQ